jgi:glucokinase
VAILSRSSEQLTALDTADGGVVVGVDIGGTHLRAGAVTPGGAVLRTEIVPSTTGLPREANHRYLADLIDRVLEGGRPALRGIGIGTTGPVDVITGLISNPYTLPGWSGMALIEPLARRFSVPVRIDNDAAAAALGEYWRGAGMGSERMAMVTVGTGIGGALVVGGRTYRGARRFHPELGHHVIDPAGPACYCGAAGCWEILAAGPAIARAWADTRRERGEIDDNGGAEGLFAAARAGDADAMRVVAQIGRYLGAGLTNIAAFYAPDVVVIGGGVSRHFDLLEPGMRDMLSRTCGIQPGAGIELRQSTLGENAGILGAAYLVLAPEYAGGEA